MPFLILGIPLLIIGFFLFRRGVSGDSKETRNGALALIAASLLIIFLSLLLLFTGQL